MNPVRECELAPTTAGIDHSHTRASNVEHVGDDVLNGHAKQLETTELARPYEPKYSVQCSVDIINRPLNQDRSNQGPVKRVTKHFDYVGLLTNEYFFVLLKVQLAAIVHL